jgi:hypothetical protein
MLADLRGEGLWEAIAYYRDWVAYAHAANGGGSKGSGGSGSEVEVLPTLTEVREGRTAPPPEPSGRRAGEAAAGDCSTGAIDIDWDTALSGGSGGGAGGAGEEAAAGGGGSGGIDWDLDLSDLVVAAGGGEEGAAGAEDGAAAGEGPSISWDIELTEAAAEGTADGAGGSGGEGAPADASQPQAAGREDVEAAAARLAGDHEYRAALSDDLQELRAFLLQRSAELSGAGAGGSAELLNALLPPAVAAVDGRAAGRLLTAVQGAICALSAPDLKQLLLIAGSGRYLDRLARELARRAGQEGRMLAAAKEAEARQHEARAGLAGLAPRTAALAERTRTAQRAVEAALSVQLGRRVNILGELNNALAAAAAATKGAAAAAAASGQEAAV